MNWLLDSGAVLQALITAACESAVLALVVYLLLRWIGRLISPSWRVALWTIPLVRMVVLVVPVISLSVLPTIDAASLASKSSASTKTDWNPTIVSSNPPYSSTVPLIRPLHQVETSVSSRPAPVMTEAKISRATILQLAWFVWLAGVAITLARWLWMSSALRRILRRGQLIQNAEVRSLVDKVRRGAKLLRQVRCIATDEEYGPATCGLFRPKIILPRRLIDRLTSSELEMIIAHEVEHIRRCDHLLLAVGRMAVALHWYNPLAYYVRCTLRREIEFAVDAATIGKLGRKRVSDYGDLLIRLVHPAAASACAVQMARSGGDLHGRIEKLVGWRKVHWSQQALGAVAACLLVLIGLCDYKSTSVIAQEQTSAPSPDVADSPPSQEGNDQPVDTIPDDDDQSVGLRASGRVVDSAGNPVPNAQLFAEVYTGNQTVERVSATADGSGEFSITYPASIRDHESYHTWVYAKGHSIRVVHMSRGVIDGKTDDLEIHLPEFEVNEFTIILPNGDPCVDADVVPRYVDIPNGVFEADESTGLSGFLPEQMKPLLSRKTDNQGRVRVEGVPLALLDSIEVKSPTYGRQHFQGLGHEPKEARRLGGVGSISGVLKSQSPTQFAGMKVYVSTEPGDPFDAEGLAETEVDENGRFQIPVIAFGNLVISFDWELDTEAHPFVAQPPKVQTGKELDLEVEVRPTIPVTGRILTADTREPIAGAKIFHRYSNQGHVRMLSSDKTDEHGRYQTRLAAGQVARQVFSGVSSPYEYPTLEAIEIPADAKALEVPDILVHPMRLVTGKLIDQTGKPVAGATVVLHQNSYRHLAGRATTDDDGSFEMHVHGWDRKAKFRLNWYWAVLDQPAVNADPPKFTRLELVNDNPDNMLLRYPNN